MVLLFFIYITLFIVIKYVSLIKILILSIILLFLHKLIGFSRLFKLLTVATILLIISYLLLPGKISEGSHTVVGEIIGLENNYLDCKITSSKDELLSKSAIVRVYNDSEKYEIGQKGLFTLNVKQVARATNPGQFSNRDYLQSLGINSVGVEFKVIESVQKKSIKSLAFKVRKRLISQFDNMPEKLQGIIVAMLFGDKSFLGSEIKESYSVSGLSHLLVVSGLHLTILTAVLNFILNKFSLTDKKQTIILLLFIWSYACLAGFSFSILRASIMTSALLIANLYNTKISSLENIILAAFILLVIYPYAIKNIGWQLSFLAVFGLLVLSKQISNILPNTKLGASLAAILSVQIMTLPVLINTFNSLSLIVIPANIMMVPFTAIILCIGVMTLLPLINTVILPTLTFLVRIHLAITSWLASINILLIFIKTWPLYIIVIYYLMVALFFFSNYKNLKRIVFTLFVLLIVLLNIQFYPELVVLDVGQGDAIYLNTGLFNGNKKFLIDAGDRTSYIDNGKKIIIPFLKSRGIKSIDSIILSHSHRDHIGGVPSLLDSIKVKSLFLSYQAYNAESIVMKEIIQKCNDKKVEINLIKMGDEIKINQIVVMDVLYPRFTKEEDSNDTSVVLKICINGVTILLTGDIELLAEKDLVDLYAEELNVDILKIPHHGSNSSSTLNFLEAVRPNIAINSSARNHFLNHPDKEVIIRYNRKGVKIYRTDQDGAIIVKIKSPLKIKRYLEDKEEDVWLQQR